MRLPLAVDIESRNGELDKDAKVLNGVIESTETESNVYKRPGNEDLGAMGTGNAQLLTYWNGLKAIIGDGLNSTGSSSEAASYTISSATWATKTLPSSAIWTCLTFGNGKYVAVAQNGSVATSTNGDVWVLSATITARNWWNIAFNGSVFCVIAYDSTSTAVSSDGITWDQTGTLPATGFYSIVSNGTIFCSPKNNSQDVATSSDGKIWTNHATVLPSSAAWQYIVHDGTVFCTTVAAASAAAATSSDGLVWTSRTTSEATQRGGMVAGGGVIVAMPSSGTTATYSIDHGVTWADTTIPFNPGGESSGAWNGSTFFICCNGSSAGLSTNGSSWTATTLSSSADFRYCAASNGSDFVTAAISSDNVSKSTSITEVLSVTNTALSPSTSGLQFSAQDNGSNASQSYLMFKNARQAWTLTNASGATPTLITDVDYPGTYTVTLTSLTRNGTTATATTPTDTNFQVGSTVIIAGATPSDYNGSKVITGITPYEVISSESIVISIVRSNTTATATSINKPHGFSNGQSITISGADQPEYNGTYIITWLSATTFSFTITISGADVASPATGSPAITSLQINSLGGNTVASPTIFNFTYANPECAGYFQNGDTVNCSAFITTGTVSSAGANSFVVTVVGQTSVIGGGLVLEPTSAPTISSITSSNNIAIVTTNSAHRFKTNFSTFNITGAIPDAYNVSVYVFGVSITVLSSTTFSYPIDSSAIPKSPATGVITAKNNTITGASFTFTVSGSPTSPATGTITATGGRNTVPGIVYLNGYFCVMDVYGVIYNSASDDPSKWNALEYVTADAETGAGKALAKSLNYVVAFKEWSTEFFYDAQNPTGSPLSPVTNGFTQVGCASGESVALLDGALVWMSQTRQKGRSVHIMQGTQQQKISTPHIERVLNRDDLSEVYAYGIKINGHGLYILTLVNSGITIVFDTVSNKWAQWSSLTLDDSVSVTSITLVGTTATVVATAGHGLSDGDPVKISGADQSGYNGIFPTTYISSTSFSIQVAAGLATPATGTILAYPYIESYFKFTHFANALGRYMVLHKTNGHLYEILPEENQDAGIPINTMFRTIRLDGGGLNNKVMSRATIVGDSVDDVILIRQSDDDMETFSKYRPADLNEKEPMIRRLGGFRRRTMEFKHTGNNPLNLKSVEIEVE